MSEHPGIFDPTTTAAKNTGRWMFWTGAAALAGGAVVKKHVTGTWPFAEDSAFIRDFGFETWWNIKTRGEIPLDMMLHGDAYSVAFKALAIIFSLVFINYLVDSSKEAHAKHLRRAHLQEAKKHS